MININAIRRNNLKRLLDQYNIEKAELARRIKTTPQYINSLLNEEKGLSDKAVSKIAAALDVDEIEFYKGLHGEEQIPIMQSQENKQQINIIDDRSLMGIVEYVTKYGTGTQYERFRAFGETIRKEIETVKKETSLQSTNVPDSSQMDHVIGLKVVSGGK